MINKKQIISSIVLFIIVSLFFRIDFRFKDTVECCSDDFDYFSHAETIAIDMDFDYSNQLPPNHSFIFEYNGKISPVGFPGTGILASPFLYFGNIIDKNLNSGNGDEVLNYKLLLYSLSPIFYLFIGYILVFKSLIILNFDVDKYKLLVLISGSGITYFAFERFSMTHSYEFFTLSLLIYSTIIFYKNGNKLHAFIVPISLMVSLLVRMSNYYIFLLPIIVKLIYSKENQTKFSLIKNRTFIFSTTLSIFIYNFLSRSIYGKLVINPQEVYGTDISVTNVVPNNEGYVDFLLKSILDSFRVIFGNEFGIFWLSPIIFAGLALSILNLKNYKNFGNILLLICFAQNFAILIIWQSTGASYGFRYLYSLVPICVIIFYYYKKIFKQKIFFNFIFLMSIFSNLSILFFETTEQTQLSIVEIINSFGALRNYSEPAYVTGVVRSLTEINSYLIIFTTSLVGVIFFKLLLIMFDVSVLINFLNTLGLPTENQDFILYLENLEIISVNKILLIILFLFSFCYYVVFRLNEPKK